MQFAFCCACLVDWSYRGGGGGGGGCKSDYGHAESLRGTLGVPNLESAPCVELCCALMLKGGLPFVVDIVGGAN